MKRILMFGKLNEVVKDIDNALSPHFHIQLCDLRSETVEGMLKVIEPELVIISLVGAQDYDKGIFSLLSMDYRYIPVITIGNELERKAFLKYYESRQFENLIRPVDNKEILTAVCRKLGLHLTEKNGQFVVSEMSLRKNVLIVDDNPVTLREIREMLIGTFDVTAATSGIQAMTAIGKKRPDLVLLDYEMPVCDGKQTLEMIRADEELKDIPVIFLTGISDRTHISAVLKLKPQGYLLKPASRDELIAAIQDKI
ncbi:MAG: response regulator [Lachnospiraceae bacterium]|nr:response regulator [Lachnospiraceae bacterium]